MTSNLGSGNDAIHRLGGLPPRSLEEVAVAIEDHPGAGLAAATGDQESSALSSISNECEEMAELVEVDVAEVGAT